MKIMERMQRPEDRGKKTDGTDGHLQCKPLLGTPQRKMLRNLAGNNRKVKARESPVIRRKKKRKRVLLKLIHT